MDILDAYLAQNDCTLIMGNMAKDFFIGNIEKFQHMCGAIIFDTLEDLYRDDDDTNIIRLIILKQESPVSIYYGTIDTDTLTSDYICSSLNEPKLRKGGLLLSFYALLLANQANPNITTFSGGISGGIPSLEYDDTDKEVITKRKALSDYI